MEKETKERLIGAGREIAIDMMHSAIHDAKDPEQTSNQMFCLGVAASHILATLAFNSGNPKAAIEEMFSEVKEELEIIKEDFDLREIESGIEGTYGNTENKEKR